MMKCKIYEEFAEASGQLGIRQDGHRRLDRSTDGMGEVEEKWRRREHWVAQQAFEQPPRRSGPKKGKNRQR